MAVFAYRGLTAAGRPRGGVLDADTARAAWQALRGQGVYPTELREQGAAAGWTVRRLGAAERAAALRALATLVAAGVPVADALGDVAAQAEHPALVRALTVARARLCEGEPLAEALAASPGVFPPLDRDLVRAGEASGALAAVLDRLAAHTEAVAAVRARLRAALTYPAVMALATAGVLAFLLLWVVPQVTQLLADTGRALPLPTRLLVAAAGAFGAAWWAILGGGAAAAWALRAWAATPAGRRRLDGARLALPVVGRLVRDAALARLARTLATLLAGGIPLEPALGIAAAATGNGRLAEAVEGARDAVRRGQPLAPALAATGAVPPLFLRLVAVGERGGALAAALDRAADDAERRVAGAVATATALVEPALVVAMGAVVLLLVSAILLPLLELNTVAP
jgi:general secretion pathway protein F